MILTDAGPLAALQDRKDQHHQRCREALPDLIGPMVTTIPAFTEAIYLLGAALGWRGQNRLWQLVWSGKLILAYQNDDQFRRAYALMDQ